MIKNVNKEKLKKLDKNKIIMTALTIVTTISLSGCVPDDTFIEQELAPGEHILLKVDRNITILGKNGKYGLVAPDGYEITDYDYDKDGKLEFDDYVYRNVEPVVIKNPNTFGEPIKKQSKEDNDIYAPGKHVLVEIKRDLSSLFGKDNEIFQMTAPEGYTVLDYDYDKNGLVKFENITYVNTQEVKISNINEFGTVLKSQNKEQKKDFYEIGEHQIVTVNREMNPFWGKNEMKQLTAPNGYRIVDYDYDKTKNFEFETIMYENTVPVIAKKDSFGTPTQEINQIENTNGEYEIGKHVLVDIKRDISLLGIGYDGTKRLNTTEGYQLLDYDYDKNDKFEFETYVYINDKKVKTMNPNNFGEVITENKVYKKTK